MNGLQITVLLVTSENIIFININGKFAVAGYVLWLLITAEDIYGWATDYLHNYIFKHIEISDTAEGQVT